MQRLYLPALVAGAFFLIVSCAGYRLTEQPPSDAPERHTIEAASPGAGQAAREGIDRTESKDTATSATPGVPEEAAPRAPDPETDIEEEPASGVAAGPEPAQEADAAAAYDDPSGPGQELGQEPEQDPGQERGQDPGQERSQEPEPEQEPAEGQEQEYDSPELVRTLCDQIGNKLTSVSVAECNSQQLIHGALSFEGRSLAYRNYPPLPSREPLGRVLVIGGIHGDEFSSVSVVFKWMNILNQFHSGLFHWRFIPAANPDGLLAETSQRQNARGVDLNRNFPTADWDELADRYWVERTYKNPRRYPGEASMSEPETIFLVDQIREFDPDIIISMHAPYHLVDYDGPPSGPGKLGGLYLRELGIFPGSLGNYFGVNKANPIVTIELKSAGIMPSDREIDEMWTDLVRWLRGQLGGV